LDVVLDIVDYMLLFWHHNHLSHKEVFWIWLVDMVLRHIVLVEVVDIFHTHRIRVVEEELMVELFFVDTGVVGRNHQLLLLVRICTRVLESVSFV